MIQSKLVVREIINGKMKDKKRGKNINKQQFICSFLAQWTVHRWHML